MKPTKTTIELQIPTEKATIPYHIDVRIAKVAKDVSSALTTMCEECKGDMGRKAYCKECLKEDVNTVKAFKVDKEKIEISKEAQEALNKNVGEIIKVQGTIPKSDIQTHLIKGSFWILPSKTGSKTTAKAKVKIQEARERYQRFYNALTKSKTALIVKFCATTSSRQQLGVLTSTPESLVIHTLPYNENIQTPTSDDTDLSDVKVSNESVTNTVDLIESLDQVDPNTIEDSYSQTLEKVLENPTVTTESIDLGNAIAKEDDPIDVLVSSRKKESK